MYEHVSGGGFAGESLPAGILSEGFGMLRTLILDFKAAGYNVITTLDSRIARLNPPVPADYLVPILSSGEVQTKLRDLFELADAVYIIAPETGGVLPLLVKNVEQTGTISLNCQNDAIKMVSDKVVFHEFMRTLGLHLPETRFFSVTDELTEIRKEIRGSIEFPVVFKPSDGISCNGVSVAQNEKDLAGAVDKIKKFSSGKHFLVQELLTGPAASVSLLSTGSSTVPISLNRQDIRLETPEACSCYYGGSVPFEHPLEGAAFEAAKKLAKSVPSLRGYIGVDFILTDETAVVIEVNPRLTTSYIGLRNVVNFNPAQAIIDAVLENRLPRYIASRGYTYFSKIETDIPLVDALQDTYEMCEVVSPPFPISNSFASALIASYGASLQEAMLRFREAKKRVFDTMNRGRQ